MTLGSRSSTSSAVDQARQQIGDIFIPHGRLCSFLEHRVAQLAAARCSRTFAADDRDPELLGDRLVRQVVDVLQHDDAAQLRRQLVDRVGDPLEASADSAIASGWDSARTSAGSRPASERLGCWRRRRRTCVEARVRGDPVHPRARTAASPWNLPMPFQARR